MLFEIQVSMSFNLAGFFPENQILLSYLICIPLGIKKALNHGSTFDFGSSVIIFVAYSIPGWALGGVLLVFFGGGSFLDIFPLPLRPQATNIAQRTGIKT